MGVIASNEELGMSNLEINNVSRRFGGLWAVRDVSMTTRPGSITAIIGPNGSGKTTLLNLVTGLLALDNGGITYDGTTLSSKDPVSIARLGIGRSFQVPRLFSDLSVLDNMMLAYSGGRRTSLWRVTSDSPDVLCAESSLMASCLDTLNTLGILDLKDYPSHKLSMGQRRLADFARVLALRPKVLLLDEPFSGLSSSAAKCVRDVLVSLRNSGINITFIEHRFDIIEEMSDMVWVMDKGSVLSSGSPQSIKRDARVIAAYLGDQR